MMSIQEKIGVYTSVYGLLRDLEGLRVLGVAEQVGMSKECGDKRYIHKKKSMWIDGVARKG